MSERWRAIEGFENLYEVSDLGRVRSLDRLVHQVNRWGPMVSLYRGRILRATVSASGYLQVTLSKGGKCFQRHVHVLVALAFHGPRPDGLLVCHDDGNKLNCREINLYYGNFKSNAEDAARHGTLARGERQGIARLTEQAVREIRELAGSVSQRDLAERYGVCQATVSLAMRGETWGHVAAEAAKA
jgi:hypothetical protein